MSSTILQTLEDWLSRGGQRIGQILVSNGALQHFEDAGRADLELFTSPEAARQIALYDDANNYRPLKTAPNLRHGWKLLFKNSEELRLALDYFYPAMLGTWVALQKGELTPVNLRETLNRQTGMYAVTKKISNPDADAMVGRACNSENGCLRSILWKLDAQTPISSLGAEKLCVPALGDAIPLICAEACNLLVAAARSVVKKAQ